MNYTLQTGINLDRTTDLKEKWYGLNSTYNLGCVTYLYKKYNRPNTVDEFYNAYTADTSITEDRRTVGRSEEYLKNVSTTLAQRDNYSLDLKDYFSYIIKKLFYDTINGAKKETELAEIVKSKGYTIKEPNFREDTEFGIDLFVYKDNKLLCILQAKPHTFFLGNNNASLINDRKRALEKEKKCKETYKVPVFYCIYNKNTGEWVRKSNGKLCWLLNTLITD